jgi:hypothetical protein
MADGSGRLEQIYSLAKEALDLHDAIKRRAALTDIQMQVLALQRDGIEANSVHAAKIAEVSALKEEVTGLKAWGADKERYEMQRVEPGVILYSLRPARADGEPIHQLCANCYDRGDKSKLQTSPRVQMRYQVHYCPFCKSEFAFNYVAPPPTPKVITGRDYRPGIR